MADIYLNTTVRFKTAGSIYKIEPALQLKKNTTP